MHAGELGGRLNPIVNETGTIQLRLPIDLDDRRGTRLYCYLPAGPKPLAKKGIGNR